MKYLLALCLCLMATATWADYYPLPDHQVFGQAHSTADKQAIDQLLTQYRQAWAKRDAQTAAHLHTADMEWINAFGRTFRDREKLKTFLANTLFPAFDAATWQSAMASFRPVSRRYLGARVTVINAQLHATPGSAAGSGGRRVSLNLVLVKHEGRWTIAQEVISDIRERRGSDH